jgi:hypothetical protein
MMVVVAIDAAMIRFWKKERQWTGKLILQELLVFALPLFVLLYGFKCIILLHGQLVIHVRRPGHFTVPVEGVAAVFTGLSYVSFSLFVILSFTDPPDGRKKRLRKILREIIRWGSFVATLPFVVKARQLAGLNYGAGFIDSAPRSYRALALVALIPVGLICLLAIFFWAVAFTGRKTISQELVARSLEPLKIRARPFSYWGRGNGMAFEVIYSDREGLKHRAYCTISARKAHTINWFKDEIEAIDV